MRNKKIYIILLSLAVIIGLLALAQVNKNRAQQPSATSQEPEIDFYTCGMHPSVKVSPQEYNKGNVNCPICNMKLTPVYKEKPQGQEEELGYYGCGMEGEEHVFLIKAEQLKDCPICGMPLKKLSQQQADRLRGVVGKVKIAGRQIQLAGVETENLKRLHLFKEIRTVGKVAYDPGLAVAQEEFISSLQALDKIQQGSIAEIKQRAVSLVESASRKLTLLGLSQEQIEALEEQREVQTSLILPQEKMWIYGDVYEYELSWVRPGARVKVTTASLPGKEFSGVISSLNPVLDAKTRSVRFRAEVDNPDLRLLPQMYVDVLIQSMYTGKDGEHLVLAIPKLAVLDTGTRKIVWVEQGNGEYEGREIGIGPEATGLVAGEERKFYPVLKGLTEGMPVVTKANFLIDSQSQITGVAATGYGGALGTEEQPTAPVHQH